MKTSAPRERPGAAASMYDPFVHAEALGLTVVHRPLVAASGLWVPERRLIVLRPGLHHAHERSTLAHEIVHAEHQDVGRVEAQERRADRIAARRLLEHFDLVLAARLSSDPGAWALEAGVTDHLMGVYLDCFERGALLRRPA